MEIKKNEKSFKRSFSPVVKLTLSGVVIAIYTVVMFYTQNFAFELYQVRIATALYSLAALFPFFIVPLGLANSLANATMGRVGPFDTIGGFVVGIITSTAIYFIKKYKLNDWFIAIPIIFGPGLIVPIWLSYFTNTPYHLVAISLCIGQVFPAIVGVILVKQLRGKI